MNNMQFDAAIWCDQHLQFKASNKIQQSLLLRYFYSKGLHVRQISIVLRMMQSRGVVRVRENVKLSFKEWHRTRYYVGVSIKT